MRKALLILLLILASALPAQAQLALPYTTFTSGQTISSSQFTADLTQISANALNRTGGTMTGNLIFSPDNTLDIGASGASRPRDLWVGRNLAVGGTLTITGATTFAALSATTGAISSNVTVGGTLGVTGAATLSSTLAVNSTASNALDVAGGIQAGTGNVNIIGTDGRIPAISSTYFASLDGSAITNISEANITDGTILARVAAAESVSGSWTFTGAPTFTLSNGLPTFAIFNTAAATDEKRWDLAWSNVFQLRLCNDANNASNVAIQITRSGTTPQLTTINTALALPTVQNVTTVAGNNNDVALNATATTLRVTTSGVSNNVLTGMSGGVDGRRVNICWINSLSGLSTSQEDASSAAADRFTAIRALSAGGCVEAQYDGTSARWRPTSS